MTVAVNDGSSMKYLLTDHLGSVVAVTDVNGSLLSQQRYLPFGGVRADVGPSVTQTDFGYTGQRALDNGLMDYHARFYDAALGRFIQPDTIIPSAANPQTWNRYSYVQNDPIALTDPSGHVSCHGKNWDDGPQCRDKKEFKQKATDELKRTREGKDTDLLAAFSSITGITPQSTCATLLGSSSNPLCDSETWASASKGLYSGPYSIQSMINTMTDPKTLSNEMRLASFGLGFREAITGVHLPIAGLALDFGVQWANDSKQGYSTAQMVVRSSVASLEGQAISLPVAGAVGALSVLDIPTTGPVGLAISGTVYISLNEAGSRAANSLNQEVLFPLINNLP